LAQAWFGSIRSGTCLDSASIECSGVSEAHQPEGPRHRGGGMLPMAILRLVIMATTFIAWAAGQTPPRTATSIPGSLESVPLIGETVGPQKVQAVVPQASQTEVLPVNEVVMPQAEQALMTQASKTEVPRTIQTAVPPEQAAQSVAPRGVFLPGGPAASLAPPLGGAPAPGSAPPTYAPSPAFLTQNSVGPPLQSAKPTQAPFTRDDLTAKLPLQLSGGTALEPLKDPFPNVDQTVSERIVQDSKKVGLIAENLLGVQGEINSVEKEVLGKVFDMESMRKFFAAHQSAVDEGQRLAEDQAVLQGQVEGLTKQLRGSLDQKRAQDETHAGKVADLQAEIAEDEVMIGKADKKMMDELIIEKMNRKAEKWNSDLRARNVNVVDAAQTVVTEILAEKAKLHNYYETTKTLLRELVRQQQYAVACHDRFSQVQRQIHECENKGLAERALVAQSSKGGLQVQQRIVNENRILKERLRKSKLNEGTFHAALADINWQISNTTRVGQETLARMHKELGRLRREAVRVEAENDVKMANRKALEKQMNEDRSKIEKIQHLLATGRVAFLRAKYTRLQAEIEESRHEVQRATVATASANAQTLQANQTWMGWQRTAQNDTQRAQQIAQDSLARIEYMRWKDEAMREEANKATLRAEASSLTPCKEIWDEKNTEKLKSLEKCDVLKRDLDATEAEVSQLSSAVAGHVAPT